VQAKNFSFFLDKSAINHEYTRRTVKGKKRKEKMKKKKSDAMLYI